MTSSASALHRRWLADGGLLLIALTAIGALQAAIVRSNGGVFTYALDDPYIHLALAERIASGLYGINTGEPASPSSSILYPLLLAPFAHTRAMALLPLIYCAVGVCVSLLAVRRIFTTAGAPPLLAAGFTTLTALGLNWIGLAFTGLEHSLHVACSVLVVLGLQRFVDRGRVDAWFVAALILGPALRYEGLALSGAALAILAGNGRATLAVVMGFVVLAIVACFSVFLIGQGLAPLPSSILVKQDALRSGIDADASGRAFAVLRDVLHNLMRNLKHSSGTALAMLANVALLRLVLPAEDRLVKPIACFVILVACAHLLAGSYGWFMRYEIYALATVAAGTVLACRDLLQVGLERFRWRVAFVVATVLATIGAPYVQASGGVVQPTLVVRASGDVYRQHFQMRRLVVDHLRGAVAVNDIGLVAFGNPGYVLDLWGLASEEARRMRMSAATQPDWMDRLVRGRDVALAMIYDRWFEGRIPADWVRLGELESGVVAYSASDTRVAFYAVQPAAAARIRTAIAEWTAGLPAGARFIEHVPDAVQPR